MKALLFGAPPDPEEVRPAPEDDLETMLAGLPFGLHDMADARLVRLYLTPSGRSARTIWI